MGVVSGELFSGTLRPVSTLIYAPVVHWVQCKQQNDSSSAILIFYRVSKELQSTYSLHTINLWHQCMRRCRICNLAHNRSRNKLNGVLLAAIDGMWASAQTGGEKATMWQTLHGFKPRYKLKCVSVVSCCKVADARSDGRVLKALHQFGTSTRLKGIITLVQGES